VAGRGHGASDGADLDVGFNASYLAEASGGR